MSAATSAEELLRRFAEAFERPARCQWVTNDGKICGNGGNHRVVGRCYCTVHERMFLEELASQFRNSADCVIREARGGEILQDLFSLASARRDPIARLLLTVGRELTLAVMHYADWYAATVRDERRAEMGARSLVYFVERDGFVKIGTTHNMKSRLISLSRGGTTMPEGMTVGPVRVLGVVRGVGREMEQSLHLRFQNERWERTEWFYPSSALLAYIDEYATPWEES